GGRNVAAWQPDSSAEAACRHVDQHQVQRPLAEQVLRHRRLPARQGDLATVTGAHARAFDLDLAAVEASFSLSLPPAVPRLAFGTAVTGPAQPGRVLIHHVGQGGDAGRQAETLKARSDLLPSLFNGCHRDYGGRCGRFFHGVALLRGFSTPSLQAQGGQRLPSYFNIERDIAFLYITLSKRFPFVMTSSARVSTKSVLSRCVIQDFRISRKV